jgi:hypothetical protein
MPNVPEPENKPQSTVSQPTAAPVGADDITKIMQTAQSMGYNPKTQQEMDMFARMTFSPEELSTKGLDTKYQTQQRQAQEASAAMDAWKPTNAGLFGLQQALNMKKNVTNQDIGESKLYEAAGINAYPTLRQSMDERSREMKSKYDSFQMTVGQAATGMADMYSAAGETYARLMDEIDKQDQRTYELLDAAAQQERLLQQMEMEHKYNMEMEGYLADLEKQAVQRNGSGVYSDTIDTSSEGWTKGEQSLDDLFNLGTEVGWCGYYASDLSDAGAVGDSWSSKKSNITHRSNPTAGDKLLVPLGVSDGKGYGHVAVVLGYNPNSGDILVVESNRDGRQNRGEGQGVNTLGVYNMQDLQSTYGNNFGFKSGNLKGKYADAQPIAEQMVGKGQIDTALESAILSPERYQPERDKQVQAAQQQIGEMPAPTAKYGTEFLGTLDMSNVERLIQMVNNYMSQGKTTEADAVKSKIYEDLMNQAKGKFESVTDQRAWVEMKMEEMGVGGETSSTGSTSSGGGSRVYF